MSYHDDGTECDKCGATIVAEAHGRRPKPFQFVVSREVPDEERSSDDDETLMDGVLYQEEARVLCKKCELKLLWWIDEDDGSGVYDVELPPRIESARFLKEMSDELEALAEDLETGLDDLAEAEREDTSE